ncbi:MAG: methyltransferase domain-containing protein [Proteobacteria bacterium]|nr:methyltransferase domain-containing protein [Pseudomonadota bacterium]
MRFKYSKPGIDIIPETLERTKQDKALLHGQMTAISHLKKQPLRNCCILCHDSLEQAALFTHRQLAYYLCCRCHHIQSQHIPSEAYPTDTPAGLSFLDVYPKLNTEQFVFRQNRIYKPKYDWIRESLIEFGINEKEIQQKSFLELGAGAGYFLATLKDAGIKHFKGIEQNNFLCNIGNAHLGGNYIQHHQETLSSAIVCHEAQIYIAFFVLEHIQDVKDFFKKLSLAKKGTILVFSVPVFSFATLLESAFEFHAGRNLDNAFHVQLYTDDSIAYALNMAGFSIINQWLFGQDMSDLQRLLTVQLNNRYPPYLEKMMQAKLSAMQDSLQSHIDYAQFCDSRHLICIKEK